LGKTVSSAVAGARETDIARVSVSVLPNVS